MSVAKQRTFELIGRGALGALAGTIATVPMTALMEAWFRRLLLREQYPLPPREIVDEVAEQTGTTLPSREEHRVGVTLAAHFAYGAATGSVLGVVLGMVAPRSVGGGMVVGALYGAGVWGLSYLGWLPALGILRPATEHPSRRNALMIGAHLVWGATAGLLLGLASRRPSPSSLPPDLPPDA